MENYKKDKGVLNGICVKTQINRLMDIKITFIIILTKSFVDFVVVSPFKTLNVLGITITFGVKTICISAYGIDFKIFN